MNSLTFVGNHPRNGILIKTLSFQSPNLVDISKWIYLLNLLQYFMFRLLGSVNDRLMMIKLLIVNELQQLYWHIYAPQKWLGEDVKDKFYEDLSPLSPLLVKMSWSWLVVTSMDKSGRIWVVMMEFMGFWVQC